MSPLQNSIRCLSLAAVIALPLTAGARVAEAYEVSPLRVFLAPSEGKTTATVSISNTRSDRLLVEIEILRRIVSEDGKQRFEPADDDFLVFPPQVLIESGRSQAVRFQALMPAQAQAQAYVLQVREVPLSPESFSGVQMAYNFGVAVYVQPAQPRARLVVEAASAINGKLKVNLRNEGNDFAFLTEHEVVYRLGDDAVVISPNEIATLPENPIVPPAMARSFVLPAPGVSDTPELQVEVRRSQP